MPGSTINKTTTLQTALAGSERAAFCHCPVSSCPGSLLPEDDTKLKKKKKRRSAELHLCASDVSPSSFSRVLYKYNERQVNSPAFPFPGSRCRTR